MMKECTTRRSLRVIRIDNWPFRKLRQRSQGIGVAIKSSTGPHLCGHRPCFCALHSTVIAAYDNVPELKGEMLIRLFREMSPFLEDVSPKLVK